MIIWLVLLFSFGSAKASTLIRYDCAYWVEHRNQVSLWEKEILKALAESDFETVDYFELLIQREMTLQEEKKKE